MSPDVPGAPTSPYVIHVRVDGITHAATQYESYDLLYLTCQTWLGRKAGVDVGVAMPIDCMTCLVRGSRW